MGRSWIDVLDDRMAGEEPGFHGHGATVEEIEKAEAAAVKAGRKQGLSDEERSAVSAGARATGGNVTAATEAGS